MSYNVVAMNGLFDAEYFDIKSSHVNDTYRIFVGKPSTIDEGKFYPVIYALDGNASFTSVMGTQRLLTQGGEVPASFVIGIGYPGDTLWAAMANRNRDYAPTDPGEMEAKALGVSAQAGGAAFLQFIQKELKPALEEKYPIDNRSSTLQGVSLGGLFAAWVLLTNPSAFNNYILSSPAIWWRREQYIEWEEAYAENHKDLQATVFISAGTLEVEEHLRADALAIAEKNPMLKEQVESMVAWSDINGWPEVAKLTPKFAIKLQSRNYPGLTILCHNMPDENHMSVPSSITSRGLRYVNGSWRP